MSIKLTQISLQCDCVGSVDYALTITTVDNQIYIIDTEEVSTNITKYHQSVWNCRIMQIGWSVSREITVKNWTPNQSSALSALIYNHTVWNKLFCFLCLFVCLFLHLETDDSELSARGGIALLCFASLPTPLLPLAWRNPITYPCKCVARFRCEQYVWTVWGACAHMNAHFTCLKYIYNFATNSLSPFEETP